jgi:hypothetical protein
MRRVATRRIVAAVQYHQPVGDRPDREFVGDSMRLPADLLGESDLTVPFGVSVALPLPTAAVCLHKLAS